MASEFLYNFLSDKDRFGDEELTSESSSDEDFAEVI